MGHSLRKCAILARTNALKDGNRELSALHSEFLEVLDAEWTDRISSPALRALSDEKLHKDEEIPLKKDEMTEEKVKAEGPDISNTIELNNASAETQKLNVTLTYEDYETEGSIASSIGGVKNVIGGVLNRLI